MSTFTSTNDPKLIGHVNEADIFLDSKPAKALLDTGSCVSLVSESFYLEHLNCHMKPVGDILNIECADGQNLPYKGYIETELVIQKGLPDFKPLPCLLLVTPDTQYSSRTPIILGTNVLQELMNDCKSSYGDQFLQKANLFTPWYLSFRSLVIRQKEPRKNKNRLAIVRSALPQKVSINPNQSVQVLGMIDKEFDYPSTTAIIQECDDSQLPDSIDITPSVICYDYGEKKQVVVTLSNLSTNTVTIAPKAVICELQPVSIVEEVFDKIEENTNFNDILTNLKVDEEDILNALDKDRLCNLLASHCDIFSTSDIDIGLCNKIKHRIDLTTDVPFKQRHRRIPPNMIEEVKQHIESLLAAGIIRPSKSPYSSNVVLVRKKNGKLRLCVDYRQLNDITVKDSFALPRLEEIFDCLHGAKYFSTMDIKSGYHQIEVEESHKERTAFTVGALGFFEYNKMPFGLTNSPSTYQRIMQEILGDLNMKICLIYLDDLIIFSNSFEQHLERLQIVLQKLKEANLKLAPEKCCFFKSSVNFLGHVVSGNGLETDPAKIEKIQNWPVPTNHDELRSFLAFVGYYRKFIKDFSKISKPLSELLPPTSPKKRKKNDNLPWIWTEKQQEIFDHLKDLLSSPPILAYPDFSLPFELHTDASAKALGAVLYQVQDGRKRVIAYASRALNKAEQKYSAFRLEFLALKWAITEKFSDYLMLSHFTVLTDNNPLTYVLSTAKLDATGQRWASALGQYNFDIQYRSGYKNADADGLSRYPYDRVQSDDLVTVEDKAVKAICNMTVPALLDTLPTGKINLVDVIEEPGQPLAQKEMLEIRRAQRQDRTIDKWRIAVIDKQLPSSFSSKEDLCFRKQYKNLIIRRGILFRVLKEEDSVIEQLVVPPCYREEILRGLHNDVGHPGQERTMRLIRDRFYWPGVGVDVTNWINSCERCIRRKSTVAKEPLINVQSSYPLDLVCIDFLSLEPAKGNIGNVLIITDHYTKFAKAVPTRNQTAKTTAEALFNEFITNFGIPTRLHSDQGANFESQIITELCNLMGMKKSHTTPYHPQGNAGPERFNRTLLSMLGTLEDEKKDWKKYVSSLVYYYNCTPHETTKTSPFELLFGRKPKLPIDAVFQNARQDTDVSESTQQYLEDLQMRICKAHDVVKQVTEKSQVKQKAYYDRKTKKVTLSPGDKVLVKKLAFEGKHKIKDKFEPDLFIITEQPRPDIPVYRLRSEENGLERILHRNHLLLVDYQETDEGKVECGVNAEDPDQSRDASKDTEEKGETNCDVTEDSPDTDSENGISVYAPDAYTNGDAHSIDLDQVERDEVERETELEESKRLDVVECLEDSEDESLIIENLNENAEHVQSNDQSSFPLQAEEQAVENVEDVKDDDKVDNVDDADDDADQKEENCTGPNTDTASRPVPAPRPVRQRKPPDRYSDYVMYQMTRTVDSRIQALDALVKSGVLNEVDSYTARKLVGAVMK